MKKLIFLVIFIALAIILIAQEIQHEAVAINIEVPVRVYKGDNFVDDLTINDFMLYEDGIPQEVLAMYLIKKTTIEREETELEKEKAKGIFAPQTSIRHFILFFEVIDYSIRLGEVIDYFFNNVFASEDKLTVVTPLKTYNLENELFANKPLEEVSSELKRKLKKDVRIGNAEYKNIMRDIITQEATYDDYLRLKNLRRLDEKNFLDFAESMKQIEGQKNIFILYQRDAIPLPSSALGVLSPSSMVGSIQDLGLDIYFNVERVKQAFSDSSISAHFLYITNTEQYQQSVELVEPKNVIIADWSMNIFGAFNEAAKATGGLVDSSANPAFSFVKVTDALENYYLLYYSPKNYKADGKFRNIKVKVKGKNYRITHRAGYIAD